MPQSVAWAAIKYIVVGVVADVLYFPVWWYTKGLARLVRFCYERILQTASNLALGIWLRNMFTPMFGQYDWQGRLISFMVRIVMLIYKLVVFAIWILLILVLAVGWVIAPVLVGWYAAYQVFNIPLPVVTI